MTTNGQDLMSTPHLQDDGDQQQVLSATTQGLGSSLKGHMQKLKQHELSLAAFVMKQLTYYTSPVLLSHFNRNM